MKPYNGYEAKAYGSRATLPVGGYVAKIQNVEILTRRTGEVMRVAFDVVEGEYTDIFKKDYLSNTRPDKKWRGNYELWVPRGDGSQEDGWSKQNFENFMASIEDSNDDYHWDWNEKGLKGKLFGALVRNYEWKTDDGKTGWSTECGGSTSIAKVREGNFSIPKDRHIKNKAETYSAPAPAASNPYDDGQLPWA